MVNVVTPFGTQKWDVNSKEESRIRRTLTVKAKASLAVAAILVILVVTMVVVCVFLNQSSSGERDYWMPEYRSSSRLGRFAKAAVSTDAAPCAVIGKDILMKNGSAVDATIAVLLCMGAINPQSMGLGGGFLMIYYNKTEGKAHFIDAREVAPRKASVDMYGGNATLAKIGGLAIAVPGELPGYFVAHKRFGILPWEELFPHTVRMCREGLRVNAHLARALSRYKNDVMNFDAMRNIFVDNVTGDVLKEGDILKRPDLARTLEIIAKEKMKALYSGTSQLSKNFLKDLKDAGSIVDKIDLQDYSPRSLEPVSVRLRDNVTLYSVSPPGSGALLAFMLQVLDGYPDLDANTTRSRRATVLALHRMLEAFKFAYARRMDMEDDDSPEMLELVKNLTSRSYADEIRARIDDTQTHGPDYYGLNVTIQEDHGTAHVSVLASNGDAVAATSTINLYFGSMVMSPSTGIILNNEMDDFSSPNITNYFGLPPAHKNHIHPGKRPMSSMSPAILVDSKGDVRLTLGANGGTQITTSVAQTIIRNLWLGDDIKRSIDAPRFHHQLLPNHIEHEQLFPELLLEDLRKMGHTTETLGSGMIGIVMGIARGKDGFLYANSDYRKGGEVDGY